VTTDETVVWRGRLAAFQTMRYARKHICPLATFFAVICGLGVPRAYSLQFERVSLQEPSVLVALRGPIVSGDYQRLGEFIKSLPPTDRIIGFALDSPGESVVEASEIAQMIKETSKSVLVTNNSGCSSACFLLFAAGSRRFVEPDALIGVHSASMNGDETAGSMAFTTAMAREAGELGVPP
jgi:hypothetical protein